VSTNRTLVFHNPRTLHALSAAGHLVVAIALGALAVAQASVLLPVALSVPAGAPIGLFAVVDLAAAAAIVMLIGAAVHAVLALGLTLDRGASASRSLELIAFAQSSGITLFLVAQLNGVTEAGALILVYAFGGGAAGLLWLQAREPADRRGGRWPFSFGAGLAVVPWGIVALYQIVSLGAGEPPAPIVRVLTVLLLIVVALAWWTERRWQVGLTTDHRASALHAALSLANGILLLVLAAGLARPSALL
jgi:Heliorhodopsin